MKEKLIIALCIGCLVAVVALSLAAGFADDFFKQIAR